MNKAKLEKTVSAMAELIAGDNKQRQSNLQYWWGVWTYDIKPHPNPKRVCEDCKKAKVVWHFEYIPSEYEEHRCSACTLLEAVKFLEKMKDETQP